MTVQRTVSEDILFFCDDEWNETVGTIHLMPYYPVNRYGYAQWQTNFILALKSRAPKTITRVAKYLSTRITPGVGLAYVPSHDPEKTETGIRDVVLRLSESDDFDDLSGCVVRHSKVAKGQRNSADIVNSVRIECAEKIEGRNVVLLDDVITTGSAMRGCAKLLMDAGANDIRCVGIGQTVDQHDQTTPTSIRDIVKQSDRNRTLIQKQNEEQRARMLAEVHRIREQVRLEQAERHVLEEDRRQQSFEQQIQQQLEDQKRDRPVDVVFFNLNFLVSVSNEMRSLLTRRRVINEERFERQIRLASTNVTPRVEESDLLQFGTEWDGVELGIVTEYEEKFVQTLLRIIYSDVTWTYFLENTTAKNVGKNVADLRLPEATRKAYFQSVIPDSETFVLKDADNFVQNNDYLQAVHPNELNPEVLGRGILPVEAITTFMSQA